MTAARRILRVRVELSAGAHAKHLLGAGGPRFEKRTALPAPTNYGAALGVPGGDGEALDVLVYPAAPLAPGTVVDVVPVGVLLRDDDDHKVLATVNGDPLPDGFLEELHAFFAAHGTHVRLGDADDLSRVLSARDEGEPALERREATRYDDPQGVSTHLISAELARHVPAGARRSLRHLQALPYVRGPAIAFPDLEAELPLPAGVAVTTRAPFVLPFALGDSACGFRVLTTDLHVDDLTPRGVARLAAALESALAPDSAQRQALSGALPIRDVLTDGALALTRRGFTPEADADRTEHGGRLADAGAELREPLLRWASELLGNAGWWGHYLEVAAVEDDPDPALGLRAGQIVVLIHLGGRFLWPAVRSGLLRQMIGAALDEGWATPAQAAAGHFGVRLDHPAGRAFRQAWHATLNFAVANRAAVQVLVDAQLRRLWGASAALLTDNAHVGLNALPNGTLLHRNGQHWLHAPATAGVPRAFAGTGQPVLLLGAPGVPSALLRPGEAPGDPPLCPHGIAAGPAGEGTGRFRLPGAVLHSTGFRVDEGRALRNLERTVEIFEARRAVRLAARLAPLVNLRADRAEAFRGPE